MNLSCSHRSINSTVILWVLFISILCATINHVVSQHSDIQTTTTSTTLETTTTKEKTTTSDGVQRTQMNNSMFVNDKFQKHKENEKEDEHEPELNSNSDDKEDEDEELDTHNTEENEDEEEEEEEECDYSIQHILRNVNTSQFLPEDFHELREKFYENPHEPYAHQPEDIGDFIEIVDRFASYIRNIRDNRDLQSSLTYISSVVSDRLFEARLEPQCTADLLQVLNGVRNNELWALKIPDSWGNMMPSGLLTGVTSSFGEFDQCIQIKSPPHGDSGHRIYGRYCQMNFNIPAPQLSAYEPAWEDQLRNHSLYRSFVEGTATDFTQLQLIIKNRAPLVKYMLEALTMTRSKLLTYGICFPASCSTQEIERIFNSMIYPLAKVPVVIDSDQCTDHHELQNSSLDGFQRFSLIVFATVILLGICATLYEISLKYYSKESPEINANNLKCHSVPQTKDDSSDAVCRDVILSFSFISNWNHLTRVCRNPERSSVLDTLRVVMTFMLFFMQSFFFTAILSPSLRNLFVHFPGAVIDESRYFPGHMPGIWFDGFMFILCVNLIPLQFSNLKNRTFTYLNYVFVRWFRVSVPLFGSILMLYLYPLTGDGPIWKQSERWLLHPCKNAGSILSSFLFYSNWNLALSDYELADHLPVCNLSSWIVSVSTQIYLFLPLLFVLLYRNPRRGFLVVLVIAGLSPLAITSPTWALGHSTYIDLQDMTGIRSLLQKLSNFHFNTIQYIASSCIGLLTGWAIIKHPTIQFPGGRRTELTLWTVAFSVPFVLFLWNDSFWQLNSRPSSQNILAWFVCSKLLWPASLGYTVYMTKTGRARKIDRILSIPSFQPIAKLSYCIYLMRFLSIWQRISSARYVHSYYYSVALQNMLFDFIISIFYGFFLHMLFEAPSLALIKIYEKRRRRRRSDTNLELETTVANAL